VNARVGYAVSLSLTLSRLGLAPVVLWLSTRPERAAWIAIALVIGFISDVLDGVVARRAQAQTAGLRVLDSLVDTVFYFAVVAAAWHLYASRLRPFAAVIAVLIGCELLNYAAAFIKFRRSASYHAYSAKVMGIGLFGALGTLFAAGSTIFILPALAVTMLAQLEVAAITWTLSSWQHDVRSVVHARRLRQLSRR
jgi:phosphatidylglycerophosphate synthase